MNRFYTSLFPGLCLLAVSCGAKDDTSQGDEKGACGRPVIVSADMSENPTTVDSNNDGLPDWIVRSTQTGLTPQAGCETEAPDDNGGCADGCVSIDGQECISMFTEDGTMIMPRGLKLDSDPADRQLPTGARIRASMRSYDVSDFKKGAQLWVWSDFREGPDPQSDFAVRPDQSYAGLTSRVALEDDGSQTYRFFNYRWEEALEKHKLVQLFEETGLPGDRMVSFELLYDYPNRAVTITVGDRTETVNYEHSHTELRADYASSAEAKYVTLAATNVTAAFDYVEVTAPEPENCQ